MRDPHPGWDLNRGMNFPRPSTICFRLADHWYDMLEAFLEAQQLSRSDGMRRIVREWLVVQRFPSIEFRDGPFGRRAALRDGPEVWEIIDVWEAKEEDADAWYAHFSWLDEALVDEAFEYFQWDPEEIDRIIVEQAKLAAPADRDRQGES